MSRILIGRITVLIGAPGAGKTTWCRHHVGGDPVLSLDDARAQLGQHAGDQTVTPAAVEHVTAAAGDALVAGRRVVIDATGAIASDRATWLDLACRHHTTAAAVVVSTPLAVCQRRNAARPTHRRVPADVVETMWRAIRALNVADLIAEGFGEVTVVHSTDRRGLPRP